MSEPTAGSTVAPELHERLKEFVEGLELRDVRIVELHGQLLTDGTAPVHEVRISSGSPQYLIEGRRFAGRFSLEAEFLNSDNEPFARINVSLVTEFMSDGKIAADDETIASFVETNAFSMAYPYLREAVHTTSVRIGLDPTVLGILKRVDTRPRSVSVVKHTSQPTRSND